MGGLVPHLFLERTMILNENEEQQKPINEPAMGRLKKMRGLPAAISRACRG